MSAVEIVNPVPADDLPGWSATLLSTFLRVPTPDARTRSAQMWARRLTPERTWGARANGRWVATLGTEPRRLSVPGPAGGTVDLDVDALTGVTVNATHRRRGLLSTMLGQSLAAAADRGDPLSVLVAAEWPIYGRFGYGPAVRAAAFTYRIRAPRAGIAADPAGAVRQVDPAEFADLGPAVFERARALRAGQVDRPPFYWHAYGEDADPDTEQVLLVHETAGVPDGLLGWRRSGSDIRLNGQLSTITVPDLVAASTTAERNLWAYLSGLDLVETIELAHRPVDEPAQWWLGDARTLRQTDAGDYLWVKFLDVPAALSARGYACADTLVIEVTDDSVDGNGAGRFRLEASPVGAECTRTSRPADLRLPARVLATGYLGGYALTTQHAWIEETTPGALRRLDALLATPLAPLCQTGF